MMNDIIERMRSGKRITETDADFPRLCEEVEKTRQLVGELNTGYHSPDEVRALLERIWGQPLDNSVRMFPPFSPTVTPGSTSHSIENHKSRFIKGK